MKNLRVLLGVLALLMCSIARADVSSFDGFERVSDEELDRMRGGFEVNLNGFVALIPFSIEQLTYVNGELVASMKLNIASMIDSLNKQLAETSASINAAVSAAEAAAQAARAAAAAQVSAALPASSNQTSNGSSAPSPPPAASNAATPSVAVNAVQQANAPTVTTSTPNLNAPNVNVPNDVKPVVTQQVGRGTFINVVQNGPSNSFVTPESIKGIATVIQNSLNNQVISNVTILNTTISNQVLAAVKQINTSFNLGLSLPR